MIYQTIKKRNLSYITLEYREKMSIALKGKKCPQRGWVHSIEQRKRQRKAITGMKLSLEARRKISESNRRRKVSQKVVEHMRKLGQSATRENNNKWKGGKSFEPYPLDWSRTFKEQIRHRDKYTCQDCGCHQVECIRKLDIHHIDEDKSNLSLDNLISLCVKCHSRRHIKRLNGHNLQMSQV